MFNLFAQAALFAFGRFPQVARVFVGGRLGRQLRDSRGPQAQRACGKPNSPAVLCDLRSVASPIESLLNPFDEIPLGVEGRRDFTKQALAERLLIGASEVLKVPL